MIEINNLTTNEIDRDFLKRTAEIVLKGENKTDGVLSIVFVGPGKMRGLNKKYRKKNRVTDVLSFGPSLKFPSFSEKETGEVVVCLQEVKKLAKKFDSDYNKELARVLIHGILHVLGYEHEKSEKEAKEMEEKQNYYLRKNGVSSIF